MRRVVILVIFLILFSSVSVNAVVINTYRDASNLQSADYFGDGSTVYLSISDGATCCDRKTATISNGNENITINISDLNEDGLYEGYFRIGSNDTNGGYIKVVDNESAVIYVSFTKISSGSKIIYAEYSKPTKVALTGMFNTSSAQLSWSDSYDKSGIWNYKLYRYDSEITELNKGFASVFTATGNNYSDRTIDDGKRYYYAVSAVDKLGTEGLLSNNQLIITPDITPPEPIETIQSITSNGVVMINWTEPNDNVGIDHYLVYKSTTQNINDLSPLANTTEQRYSDNNTKDGQILYYSIIPVDKDGNKGDASTIRVTIDKIPPETIHNFGYETRPNGSIYLSWTPINDAEYYNLYSSKYNITDIIGLSPVRINSSEYFFTPQDSKYYAITAVDSSGNEGEMSNVIFAAPDSIPPSPPENIRARAEPNKNIILEWDKSASGDVALYKIYRKENDDYFYINSTSSTNFTDSNVINGVVYNYKIKAVDDAGNEDMGDFSISIKAEDRFVSLEVTQPEERELSLSQSQLIVMGKTDVGASVEITGLETMSAVTDSQGNFIGYANLSNGNNIVSVKTTDTSGNTKEIKIKINNVYRETASSGLIDEKLKNISSSTVSGDDIKKYFSDVDPFITGRASMFTGNMLWNIIIIAIVLIIFMIMTKKLSKDIKKHFSRRMEYEYKKQDKLRKERESVKGILHRYISPSIAKKLIKNPDLKRVKKEVTVLFSDINQFTNLSKNKDPENIAKMLDKFFGKMSEIIQKNGGMVDKYIGDRVFAVFNAATEQANHPMIAIKTAMEMRDELEKLNKKIRDIMGQKISISTGIKTGEVAIGNIGSKRLSDFTVVGDTVNIASKLTDRANENEIMIDEDTYEKVRGKVKISEPISIIIKDMNVIGYKVLSLI